MRLTVIVPLFNDEVNISRCLNSILNELWPKDELIVVDNGSTDHSIDIVNGYKNVKLFSLPDGNVGAVRNYGAQKSSGEIIAFIDSDCTVETGWRVACDAFFNNGDINNNITGSKYKVPFDAPWFIRVWFSQKRPDGKVAYINSGNFIIKKTIFIQVGGFNESLIAGEDSELCDRLRTSGYSIYENSAISVVHYGNPENLTGFFKQQRWHGLSKGKPFPYCFWDKPFSMTILFAVTVLLALGIFFIRGIHATNLLLAMAIINFSPLVSTGYRCYKISLWGFFPQLWLLYCIYFTARLNALIWTMGGITKYKRTR